MSEKEREREREREKERKKEGRKTLLCVDVTGDIRVRGTYVFGGILFFVELS